MIINAIPPTLLMDTLSPRYGSNYKSNRGKVAIRGTTTEASPNLSA